MIIISYRHQNAAVLAIHFAIGMFRAQNRDGS